MNRAQLIQSLRTYQTSFEEESLFVPRFISLLHNFPNCYQRKQTTGHVTGSAWIIDETSTEVLLVHHKKLDRWLQPGGHADGDENILQVAMKEAKEETGLQTLRLASSDIFDIDIHQIPTHREVKTHLHHDIRFLFIADPSEPLVPSEESNELAWMPIEEVGIFTKNNRSIHRMILKTKLIFK